jgi:predicted nucleic acid-binding protein
MEQAEAGEFVLSVCPLKVVEAYFARAGYYWRSRAEIRGRLRAVLSLKSLDVWDEANVQSAVDLVADWRMDFNDAYLAMWAAAHGDGVASLDRGLKKLPVERLEL